MTAPLGTIAALADIASERQRQVEIHGFDLAHDDQFNADSQLADAAACYCLQENSPERHRAISSLWPWHKTWFSPSTRRRDLVKAAALIVAEIERLDRAASQDGAAVAETPS